jgi:BlaI family penicillinase repressor
MPSTSPHPGLRTLGKAEQRVVDYVWSHGPVSAEGCREGLQSVCPMKESTMRTVLRRLEEKGYVTHSVDGRTYIYEAARTSVVARAVRHLIDRFCGGSAKELVIGLVKTDVLDAKELEALARQIAQEKRRKS